jgi:hypothetical protein
MQRNPGRRTRISRAAVIICAVVMAVVGAAAAGWRISEHSTALPRVSCGSVATHFLTGDTRILAADHGALTCFVRAARKCRSARIGVTELGVDTGTDYVFAIKPGGTSCRVTELSQGYSANFGGTKGAVRTVSCHRAAVTRRGVALRCGGRVVLIPAKVSAPSRRSA